MIWKGTKAIEGNNGSNSISISRVYQIPSFQIDRLVIFLYLHKLIKFICICLQHLLSPINYRLVIWSSLLISWVGWPIWTYYYNRLNSRGLRFHLLANYLSYKTRNRCENPLGSKFIASWIYEYLRALLWCRNAFAGNCLSLRRLQGVKWMANKLYFMKY